MTSIFSRLLGSVLLAALTTGAWAQELPIIAKARAYVATEDVLNGIKSVRYIGTLTAPDPKDATKQVQVKMDIVFQKPERQRIIATSATQVETTALDGYEGWRGVQAPNESQRNRLNLLTADQVKRLRANTWENLAFFRGIEAIGGKIEDRGTVTVEGVTCQKVAYVHSPTIQFIRYFDTKTGRLVYTETESGGTIRESGEMRVSGMRFPKSLTTSTKNAKTGATQTVTIEFEKIEVNEVFPESLFRVPMPARK